MGCGLQALRPDDDGDGDLSSAFAERTGGGER